jgi:vacuolar-type H+-ATPase subunit I/STV1
MSGKEEPVNRLIANAWVVVVLLPFGGCRTFEGRYVKDPAPGQYVGGMPIVVERPRWLKVTYTNIYYGRISGGNEVAPEPHPELEITTAVVPVGEVFTVDFKRPLSGDITYRMDFAPGRQYPTAIHSEVKDETLKDAAKSIEQIKDLQEALKKKKEEDAKKEAEKLLAQSSSTDERVKLYDSIDKIEYYDLRSGLCVGWVRADATRVVSAHASAPVSRPPPK